MLNANYVIEFTELAKRLNYTETARALNMSQPSLSKHISQFEKELKLELFKRDGNSLRLTKCGAELLPLAYRAIEAMEELDSKAHYLRRHPPAHLSISGLTDEGPSTEVLGFLISLINSEYGANCLEVKHRYNKNPAEMLESGDVDIVFDPAPVEEMPEGSNVEVLRVADLKLTAIVDVGNPLALKDRIGVSDLEKSTFVRYEGIYLSRSWCYIEEACERHGFTPKTRSCLCSGIPELFALCAGLGDMVLVVGSNFGARIPEGIKPFCRVLDVGDGDFCMPLQLMYRKDNDNPVLTELVARIEAMPNPPLRFE